MLDLRGVHVVKKIPGTQNYRLAEVHPALRFANEESNLYIQDGRVFDAGGNIVGAKDIPDWFKDAVSKANPVALREAGWKGLPKD